MEQSICPYCSEVADNVTEEVVHMNLKHPDIVVQRLRDAGMHREAENYETEFVKKEAEQ
jgi:hypothetical protein